MARIDIAAFQSIHQQNFADATALVFLVHRQPAHQRCGVQRVRRKLQLFNDCFRDGIAPCAVGRKRVVAEYEGAIRHNECGGDSCLNFLPDPLPEISVQRFVAAGEVVSIVLRSERFDRKQSRLPAVHSGFVLLVVPVSSPQFPVRRRRIQQSLNEGFLLIPGELPDTAFLNGLLCRVLQQQ